ncbi:hypothetical protein ACFKHW_08125 [Bradyrhizobium lupini]|uniref:hypothetical protein n=1 Tax=Rhizobium lupini TaxID=136996 RepID=UPI003671D205
MADLIERLKMGIALAQGAQVCGVGDYAREDGYVTKAALLAAGLLPGDKFEEGSGGFAAKLEWRRKMDVDLTPQSSEETAKARVKNSAFLGRSASAPRCGVPSRNFSPARMMRRAACASL